MNCPKGSVGECFLRPLRTEATCFCNYLALDECKTVCSSLVDIKSFRPLNDIQIDVNVDIKSYIKSYGIILFRMNVRLALLLFSIFMTS